jgi:hypothetical protein
MANLNYTVGNWTVVSNEVDTISVPKNLATPDIDWAHDYSVAAQAAGRTELLNISGTTLDPVEKVRITQIKVDNIFHGLDVPDASKLLTRKGSGVILESIFFLEATNGVSGESLVIPYRIQTRHETIPATFITKSAVDWAQARHFGQMLKTGLVDSSLILAAFRGDTDPTK